RSLGKNPQTGSIAQPRGLFRADSAFVPSSACLGLPISRATSRDDQATRRARGPWGSPICGKTSRPGWGAGAKKGESPGGLRAGYVIGRWPGRAFPTPYDPLAVKDSGGHGASPCRCESAGFKREELPVMAPPYTTLAKTSPECGKQIAICYSNDKKLAWLELTN